LKKLFLAFFFALVAGSASAKDAGKWYCSACTINGSSQYDDLTETLSFIFNVVNPTVSAWVAGDVVTVCATGFCLTMVAKPVHPQRWIPLGPATPDNGRGYKNVGGTQGAAGTSFARASVGGTYEFHPIYRLVTVCTVQGGDSSCSSAWNVIGYTMTWRPRYASNES
jgi:hypothetical protein